MMSKVKPKLSPAQRKPLVEAGLIRLEKRGQPTHIVLEDKAWDWANNNFEVTLSRSYDAAPVLQALLAKLGRYIDAGQVSLAEVLTTSETSNTADEDTSEGTDDPDPNNLSTDDLSEKIRQAYFSVPEAKEGFRVRLHQLREQLPELSEQQTNEGLLAMQQRGEISLRRAEDLQELNADDESAAIDMGDGDKRYFALMKS